MTDPILGIDLGTTNTAVAMIEGEDPEIIPSKNGNRTIPSVVAFTEEGERLVGEQAKNQAVQNPEGTVESIKRHMGEDDYRVNVRGEEYRPEKISAIILQDVKGHAEEYLGEDIDSAVITTPAHFTDKQRQATKDAGEIAGFEVQRIINEPTAAAMAYGIDDDVDQTVMVYDLGGGTFDVSILDVGGGIYEVIATSGDNNLGGDDWDQAIVDWLLIQFETEHEIDLRNEPQALQRINDAAEKAKIELSNRQTTDINLPFITADDDGPIHLEYTLTRDEFESMSSHLVERTNEPVNTALEDAGKDWDDIDQVVLVGGGTRMPMIREEINYRQHGVNPDEAVGLGAAIQAGIIKNEVSETTLLDVTPLPLGIEVKDGMFKELIPKNTKIPTDASDTFTTAMDNQTTVDVRVYQGERRVAEENELLDEFTLAGIPPAPSGVPRINVTFSIDVDGIVHVEAEDQASGNLKDIRIEGGVGLSDERIEELQQEAEDNMLEDKRLRKRREANSAGKKTISQAKSLIEDYKQDLPESDVKSIESKIASLTELLEADNPAIEKIEQATDNLSDEVRAAGEEIHQVHQN